MTPCSEQSIVIYVMQTLVFMYSMLSALFPVSESLFCTDKIYLCTEKIYLHFKKLICVLKYIFVHWDIYLCTGTYICVLEHIFVHWNIYLFTTYMGQCHHIKLFKGEVKMKCQFFFSRVCYLSGMIRHTEQHLLSLFTTRVCCPIEKKHTGFIVFCCLLQICFNGTYYQIII